MKRAYICGLILCILLFTGAVPADGGFENINSYEDIPGVTEKEKSDIEAIKASREYLSYGHLMETEAYMLPEGTMAGFTIELCAMLTELFGIPFVPELWEPWTTLRSELHSFALDFTGELTPTPERAEIYYMTHPIADRSLRLITLAESDRIKTEADVEGLTLGFYRDVITPDSILSSYPFSFELVYFDDEDEAVGLLRTGIIDAVVAEAVIDPSYAQYSDITSKIFFPLIYTPVSMATANPELEPIISVMNKYLMAGGIDKLQELYKQCEADYIRYKLDRSFTQEERQYITAHSTGVGIAAETDNYPISFYNMQEKAFQGIFIDILDEVSELTGLEFHVKNSRDTAWFEILEKLRSGEISLVSELVYSAERAKEFIWVDTPSISTSYALLSKSGFPSISTEQVIRARVGATRDSIYEDMYNIWFPSNDNLILYDSLNATFDALESGEIDLMMATELLLVTQSNYRENPGYKVNISFNTPVASLIGLNKNETTLLSIINKAMAYVDIDAIDRNWTHRTFDYSKKMANMRAAYLLGFSLVLTAVLTMSVILLLNTRRLSKDLVRQTQESEVASKAKSAFLALMSHEIRTPLNAIIGMATIAKNSIDDREKTITSIEHILSASNHLLGLLNDVLDMSKIESGKLELAYEPFAVNEAFTEVSSVIHQRCIDKGINYSSAINGIGGDMGLIGDKLRINQVLFNLLGNSLKFTAAGGEIAFTVEAAEEDSQSLTALFTVTDTGIGIPPEHLQRLFDPFEQGDKSITAKFGGTGLGLSISQNLIKMMGGEIQAESRPGDGAKFWFSLRIDKAADTRSNAEEFPTPDLRGKRLLLVEDIEINRIIVEEMLSETGAEIIEAEDGLQAFEIFQSSPPGGFDLILMDIQMPVMDGYEATRRIRETIRADARTVPIIAMTANAYKKDVDEALAAGMSGHLSKPLDIQMMNRLLTLHCSGDGAIPPSS